VIEDSCFQKSALDKVHCRLFCCLDVKKTWGMALFSRGKRYNPIYNLQTMMPRRETDKLGPRGNMTNKKNEPNKENQDTLSTGTRGGSIFEIHVRGQLDESWTDWLEGLEVTLLENGEMILSGHIGDQAALMGILNKLYGLNLALLSVNEMKKQ
jgi:hypothetical protein